jgi:hypothetical protein
MAIVIQYSLIQKRIKRKGRQSVYWQLQANAEKDSSQAITDKDISEINIVDNDVPF